MKEALNKLRHSAAHLLAHAIQELYPTTQLTIGPATEDGFFYDVLPTEHFKEEDLPKIEQKMHEIAKRNLPIIHREISKKEAVELYKNNPFKLELIEQIPGETVGIAEQGNFKDLCKGGHVENTGEIKHVKLLSLSGSYWRANKDNQPLQRIYGTAFFTQDELDAYSNRLEEAKKYDHRKIGKELDLFSFHEEGTGFPFFHPGGIIIIEQLKKILRKKLNEANYQEVATPIMLSEKLWQQSGHYDHYKDYMYFCGVEGKNYAIKPMNCPGAILIYKTKPHSYRELPLRLSEFGKVHRHELSGVLHGLFRVRAFTIDDGHIFCTPEQIEQEVRTSIENTMSVLNLFNFPSIKVALSTKPENAIGSDTQWEKATKALMNALDKERIPYTLQEGEGAFYGPKIEFHIEDSMGRSWQCGTIQLDFFLPERFELSYVTSEGIKATPVIIHRAIIGSFERFLGMLVEHYKGKLPFWLAPTQVAILTITDEQKPYAQEWYNRLKEHGIRVELDETSDPLSGKIKHAQLKKIPWMLVIGNKEAAASTVTLRYQDGKQEFGLSRDAIEKKIAEELQRY